MDNTKIKKRGVHTDEQQNGLLIDYRILIAEAQIVKMFQIHRGPYQSEKIINMPLSLLNM